MRFVRIFQVLAACFLGALSAQAGMISSGGGETVQLSTGAVHFLDLVNAQDLARVVRPQKLENAVSARCVSEPSTPLTPERSGVDSRIRTLKRHHKKLGYAIEYSMNRILRKVRGVNFDLRPLKIFSDSARVAASLQFPVGGYGGSYLVVNQAAFAALPQKDRDAFLFHEALREYAAFFDPEGRDIRLSDIETAVPLIVDSPFSPQLPRLLKQSNTLDARMALWDLVLSRTHGGEAAWFELFTGIMDQERMEHEEPDLAVSIARMQHEIAEAKAKAAGDPRLSEILADTVGTLESSLAFFKARYRSGIDPKVRMKLLEFEVAVGVQPERGTVFDTVDFVWRKQNDPVCRRR